MNQGLSPDLWQLFTYATDDGKAIAEYRVDGAWAVVRVDGRERPPIPEKRDDAKRVSARLLDPANLTTVMVGKPQGFDAAPPSGK